MSEHSLRASRCVPSAVSKTPSGSAQPQEPRPSRPAVRFPEPAIRLPSTHGQVVMRLDAPRPAPEGLAPIQANTAGVPRTGIAACPVALLCARTCAPAPRPRPNPCSIAGFTEHGSALGARTCAACGTTPTNRPSVSILPRCVGISQALVDESRKPELLRFRPASKLSGSWLWAARWCWRPRPAGFAPGRGSGAAGRRARPARFLATSEPVGARLRNRSTPLAVQLAQAASFAFLATKLGGCGPSVDRR